MKKVKIGNRIVGEDAPPFFSIEEGQANWGHFKTALKMVDLAAEAGADGIDFQLARADDFYIKNHPEYESYRQREFSDDQLRTLVAYIRQSGLEMIVTPLSHRVIQPLAEAGCSAFNVNASDLTNPDIIDAVVETGLSFFLSLPLAVEEEIDWAVNRVLKKGAKRFILMHGQHTMASGENGVKVRDTALGYISILKEKYDVLVGFIDHTPLQWMPACATAAGADVISKHLTWSREVKGPDWHICLEPGEMKEAIQWVKQINRSMKIREKCLAPGEDHDRSLMRRSIVAARKVLEGQKIKREDICFKRPGDGFDPSRYEEIVGKASIRNISPDEKIDLSDVKDQ
ncbi:MAG: hypothetical protein A2W61_03115 [Deltaproteobacteria bacterium RIFCSPLOWO2_01_44_7]|nr:MAG: hypothetical protein A2712_02595 [Deltaproteobacteria bacterium RIFCSPHIGHO2_01_FULL_43_49]OGQ16085.1 MAG: hypothetical protein A3D22_00565 [Deltaproteobacteria bacterium RIFCSPHIGHO2_02_FULL_44_53]OGQ29046.1 MAG: hypothetical protein A3D98_04350 [Deltaproteobacteria bacterium RIFCSPHIGHO2_12_FULL_44_21]OGQ32602.1 MAG: hypothetical protein A2979_08495 [Deltaproteobacteria bacterium RIFCSPLOWO2_01_FULL_45_74]OGQ38344.1 MAG: hypothetical protein A2W61_03115 [Deltaproteobacteria bacterium 